MRDGQPRNRLRVNWSHPLVNGCVWLPMFDVSSRSVQDVLLPGTVNLTIGTGSIATDVRHNASTVDFSGATDSYYQSDVAPTVLTHRITVWALYVHKASGAVEQTTLSRWQTATTSARQFMLFSTTGNLQGFILRGSTQVVISGGSLSDGQLYSAIGTADGTNVTLYLNGSQVATTASGLTLNTSGIDPYRVGNQGGNSSDFFGRFIAGGVWDRALDVAERQMLLDDPWCMLRVDPAPLMMRTWRIPVYGGAIAGQGVAANPTLRGRGWQ